MVLDSKTVYIFIKLWNKIRQLNNFFFFFFFKWIAIASIYVE